MSGGASVSDSYTKKGLWLKILMSCLLLVGVGTLNSLWTQMDYKDWYISLEKPFFSPPSSRIVGMIWTFMYITMGVSTGVIWQVTEKSSSEGQSIYGKKAIRLFVIQIVVNMIVPVFFFAFNNLYLLLMGVIMNLLLVAILIPRFYRINKMAAIILIPYLMWLVYATLLDASLLWLNTITF